MANRLFLALAMACALNGLTACGDACDDLLDLCKTCPDAIVAVCQNVAYAGDVRVCQNSLEANAAICGGSTGDETDTAGGTEAEGE